jgi:hypothetical protein
MVSSRFLKTANITADHTLRVLNLAIDIAGSKVNELSTDIRKKHLEPQPRFGLGLPCGL